MRRFIKFCKFLYSSFLIRDYYVRKKSKFLTSLPVNMHPYILVHTLRPSLPPHICIHKMIHYEKRKIKYTTIFYLLHLKKVRLIKKTGLEHSNTCEQCITHIHNKNYFWTPAGSYIKENC